MVVALVVFVVVVFDVFHSPVVHKIRERVVVVVVVSVVVVVVVTVPVVAGIPAGFVAPVEWGKTLMERDQVLLVIS